MEDLSSGDLAAVDQWYQQLFPCSAVDLHWQTAGAALLWYSSMDWRLLGWT